MEKCADLAPTGDEPAEEGILRPLKRKSDPDLGREALLVIVQRDLEYLLGRIRSRKRSTHDMGYFTLHRMEGEQGESFSISGPFLGAPHAVMGMEKIIALGARRIWVLGWCGSLQPHVRIGDLLLPTGALSEEGTSPHYPIGKRTPRPDESLVHGLEGILRAGGIPYRKGPVWTTDAPYRETPSKVLKYRNLGLLAVDMEMSAVMTLGAYRSVQVGALLVVSDELFDLKWRPGFKSPLFQEARRHAAELLINVLECPDESSRTAPEGESSPLGIEHTGRRS